MHRRDLTFNLLNVVEVSRQSFVWRREHSLRSGEGLLPSFPARTRVHLNQPLQSQYNGYTPRTAFQSQPAYTVDLQTFPIGCLLSVRPNTMQLSQSLARGQSRCPRNVAATSPIVHCEIVRFFAGSLGRREIKRGESLVMAP